MKREKNFDENRVKLIRAFKSKVSGGKSGSRVELLALAYLRDRPYIELEAKINEDHESFGIGKYTFLKDLATAVALEICKEANILGVLIDTENHPYFWMQNKYKTEQKIEEKAA